MWSCAKPFVTDARNHITRLYFVTALHEQVACSHMAVHSIDALAIVVVLWCEADAFRAANRFARGLRWTLLVAFGFMGLAMLFVETWRPAVVEGVESP